MTLKFDIWVCSILFIFVKSLLSYNNIWVFGSQVPCKYLAILRGIYLQVEVKPIVGVNSHEYDHLVSKKES